MEYVKIGHIKYPIERPELIDENEDIRGQITYYEKIELKKGMIKDNEDETLMHEAIHGISFHSGINLKENQVQGLAYGIINFIRDNPELMMKIMKITK